MSSPCSLANVSLACDRADRLWISWDSGEVNWGKDWNSQHFSPRGGNGLYRTRDLVPPHLMTLLTQGRVLVTNWHVFEPQAVQTGGVSAKVTKAGVAVRPVG